MAGQKVFAGARLRTLRTKDGLTQKQMGQRLGISTSYVNQIENNQRPLTAALMLALAENFGLDLTALLSDSSDRVLADLREIMADPVFADAAPGLIELKNLTVSAPDSAHALLRLYEAYRKTNERLASVDAAMESGPSGGLQTAYEEVRDFFHYAGNYLDDLDRAAEALAGELGGAHNDRFDKLVDYIETTHDIRVQALARPGDDTLRRFDRRTRVLQLNARLPRSTQFFQAAAQLALMEQTTLIEDMISAAGFKTSEAGDICRIGLANYFAGALHMPYAAFLESAETNLYDLDELCFLFGASREQVAHRLSTLQRPKHRGVPFFFARLDAAGTITKRHSATPLQFARFGGACPLWNVHRAFEERGEIIQQLAETPDGHRYLCLAWSEQKRVGGHNGPVRRYAYALGCEITHADKLIYANDLDAGRDGAFEPIGVSCRICERRNCVQRSVPPVAASISVDPHTRAIVPFSIR